MTSFPRSTLRRVRPALRPSADLVQARTSSSTPSAASWRTGARACSSRTRRASSVGPTTSSSSIKVGLSVKVRLLKSQRQTLRQCQRRRSQRTRPQTATASSLPRRTGASRSSAPEVRNDVTAPLMSSVLLDVAKSSGSVWLALTFPLAFVLCTAAQTCAALALVRRSSSDWSNYPGVVGCGCVRQGRRRGGLLRGPYLHDRR